MVVSCGDSNVRAAYLFICLRLLLVIYNLCHYKKKCRLKNINKGIYHIKNVNRPNYNKRVVCIKII